MAKWYRLSVFFLLMAETSTLYGSCAGVPNCDPCGDTEVIPTKEELSCKTSSDCVVIEMGCGGWMVVNKTSEEIVKKREAHLRSITGRTTRAKKPTIECAPSTEYEAKICGPLKNR